MVQAILVHILYCCYYEIVWYLRCNDF